MARYLLLYSTTDGHTLTISRRIASGIEARGHGVTVRLLDELDDQGDGDLDGFDAIVIGASIRYGKHQPRVGAFIERQAARLERTPSAFFSVNIVARKPNKNTPQTNPYMRKFLARIPWQPRHLAVFAGRLDYPSYRFFDRLMIRFIMLITKGPTDPTAVVEFTDWAAVDAFAQELGAMA